MFQVKEQLTEDEIRRGLRALIGDGMASQAMAVLTGGVFLVALALELGASNFQIGLLASIPALTQVVQIPSIYLVDRLKNRRAVVVVTAFLCRLPWLLIALVPFFFVKSVGLTIVIGGIFMHTALGAVAGCAWNSWMRDFVPEKEMGTFFSKRMKLATGVGIILSLLAGVYIDWWKKGFPDATLYGYAALFGLGFMAGMVGIGFIARIPETRMLPSRTHFFNMIAEPFRHMNYRKLILFMGAWSFAMNLAAPFFTVYMLDRLNTGMALVVVLSVVSQIFNFLFIGLWGRFADRFSNKSVLLVSSPLFMIAIIAWTFTTLPEKHVLTLPLLFVIHALMGASTAGVSLAAGNISLKLAPKGQATAYLVATAMMNAVAAGIAPILGGKFADFFAERSLSFTLQWTSPSRDIAFQTLDFRHWDFFFGMAFLFGLYAMHRLSMVEEEGEVEEEIVRDELMAAITRPIRSLSTAAGLFQILSFPAELIRGMTRKDKKMEEKV